MLPSLVCCVCSLTASPPPQEAPVSEEVADYELHEWGVFPVPRNSAWAMADLLSEWKTFPDFFHGSLPQRELVYRGPVTKPVIWLHGREPRGIVLEVRFTTGRPLIWWPSAEIPASGAPWVDDTPGLLQWRLGMHAPVPPLGEGPGGGPENANPAPEVAADHWIQSLRSVVSAPVFTNGSNSRLGRGPVYQDSFLYYDGVMKAPPSPQVERVGDGVLVHSACDHVALDVMCIERRDGAVFVAKDWFEIPEGSQRTSVEMVQLADVEAGIAALVRQLVQRTAKPGLKLDEAMALGDVWSEGFFGVDGLSLLYRIPRSTYDAWLPLKAEPAPAKTVRVGWVLHQRLEPELEASVRSLLTRLGDERVPEPEWRAAARALAQIGGAAFPWMKEAVQAGDEPLATRVREVLDALDVVRFLDLPEE